MACCFACVSQLNLLWYRFPGIYSCQCLFVFTCQNISYSSARQLLESSEIIVLMLSVGNYLKYKGYRLFENDCEPTLMLPGQMSSYLTSQTEYSDTKG
jgi:hypothetical protein